MGSPGRGVRLVAAAEATDAVTLHVVVRGRLASAAPVPARRMHDEVVARTRRAAKSVGVVSHALLVSAVDAREVMAIDTVTDQGQLEEFLLGPGFLSEMALLFCAPPEVTVWTDPGWLSYRGEPGSSA